MTAQQKRLRAETDMRVDAMPLPQGAKEALAAERAAGDARERRLLFMLCSVDTLIEVEQRHVSHDYEHEPGDIGEQYEDCSACRWHQIREGIRAALREEAPDAT